MGSLPAQLSGATGSRGLAYAALRSALSDRQQLRAALRKTFYERPTWLSVMHSFHRILLLNALAIHAMAVLGFTTQAITVAIRQQSGSNQAAIRRRSRHQSIRKQVSIKWQSGGNRSAANYSSIGNRAAIKVCTSEERNDSRLQRAHRHVHAHVKLAPVV